MSEEKQEVWAVVELMGHVKLAGILTEEEKFGTKLGRLDIPQGPDAKCKSCEGTGLIPLLEGDEPNTGCITCTGYVTQFFGGGSVYRITLVTEEVARHVAKKSSPQPVHSWDFPKQLTAPGIGYAPGDPDSDDRY